MAKVESFSPTQQVMDTEQWETCRFMDEHSKTVKFVTAKMRQIVVRLLSKYKSEYDIDDFEFLVADSIGANAFFFPKTATRNGKYVLAVSSDMIHLCDNEDEFAAVIGHELGHFTYKRVFGEDTSNTVFQERGADWHSVDLLIDGGYNPRAYQNIAKRLFNRKTDSTFEKVLKSLGVHGDGFSRVEDIEAYMTYLKKERGELDAPEIVDDYEWIKFQQQFYKMFENDRYKSYIDHALGYKKLSAENMEGFLTFVAAGLKSGELDTTPRIKDISEKLAYFVTHTLPDILYLTPDGAEPAYQVSDVMRQKIAEITEFFINRDVTSDACNILRNLQSVNRKKLPLVGAMHDLSLDLQKFIRSVDKQEMEAIASKWMNKVTQIKTSRLAQHFEPLPGFVFPPAAQAVGQPLPYAQHLQVNSKKLNEFMIYVFGIPKMPDMGLPLTERTWADGKSYSFMADDDYIIQHIGRDAAAVVSKQIHEGFVQQLAIMQKLYRVYTGKMSGDEFWAEFPPKSGIVDKIIDYRYDLSVKSSYWDADKRLMMKTAFYKDMCRHRAHEESYRFLETALAPAEDAKLFDGVMQMLVKAIDTTNDYETKSVMLSVMNHKLRHMGYNESGDIRKTANNYRTVIKKKFAYTVKPVEFFDYFKGFDLHLIIDEQIRNGEATPELDHVFNGLNIAPPKDAMDFENRVREINTTKEPSGLYAANFPRYWFIRCLMQDLPVVDDLDRFLRRTVRGRTEWDETRYLGSMLKGNHEEDETMAGIFAQYIRRHNLFPQNDFYRAFDIYVHMENNKWFSKDAANQSEWLWVLVRELKKLPLEQQRVYAFKLLAGTYSDEYGTWRQDGKKTITNFPLQETELMKIYVDALYAELGPDNDTFSHRYDIREIKRRINGTDTNDVPLFNNTEKAKLFRMLSDKMVSQQNESEMLNHNVTVSDAQIQNNDKYGRAAEAFLAFLESRPRAAVSTIEFLNRRLTSASVNRYRDELVNLDDSYSIRKEWITTEFLEFFYNSFWNEGLAFRSVVMNKLLNRISNSNYESERIDAQIQYVCNMHFPESSPYRQDAEFIFKTAIMAFEPFERGLILAAIAAADENKDDQHKNAAKSVGAGLRMFFENMGPAWVKFGQLLSYVPELPSEIRDDLGKLKDKADIPARWDLFESIKTTLPAELQKSIVHVDEILGAGSFWVTAKIKYVDVSTGQLHDKVLSLLRPNALKKTRSGFAVIEKAVADMAAHDTKYKPLLKVAQQARKSAEYEVDVVYGNAQFEQAKKLYGDISVTIDGVAYTPNVSDWEYYGVGKDAVGYKLMDLARGHTLDKVNASADTRRKMALAYVTIELTNLFKGNVWDIDRHMGQQNFEILPDGNVNINIYDTGAQMNRAPDAVDKMLLADVLYDLMHAARMGIGLDKQILETIRRLDNIEAKYKINTSYVADVQKGLMALSDIIEYQKEIKDKDGNIIQPRLTLSADDLANAVEAAYASPSTDTVIKMSLAGKILLNKLRPRRTDAQASNKKQRNPVRVNISQQDVKTNSVHMDKPASEIAEIEQDAAGEKILGINKKYIVRQPADVGHDVIANLHSRVA